MSTRSWHSPCFLRHPIDPCEAILAALPQQETPAPITQLVPDWLP